VADLDELGNGSDDDPIAANRRQIKGQSGSSNAVGGLSPTTHLRKAEKMMAMPVRPKTQQMIVAAQSAQRKTSMCVVFQTRSELVNARQRWATAKEIGRWSAS
jgi:hypothetical protein